MTQFSEQLKAKVIELLTKYGEQVSFTRKHQGVYDPTTAINTTPTTATYSGMAYRYPYSQRERAGTMIQAEDQRFYAHRMTAIPVVGDELTCDGIIYRIMHVEIINVSGDQLLYILQVRV